MMSLFNYVTYNVKGIVSLLFVFLQVGTDVDQWSKENLEKPTQPFLLSLGPASSPTQYFIICDYTNIPVVVNLLLWLLRDCLSFTIS